MHKSKSVQLISTFSDDEVRRFSDFLRSPYFNKNTRVAGLFDELKKDFPVFESKSILKEKLYSKLFKGKPYNEQVMKNLNTELFRLLKEFLAHDMLGKNRFEKSISLITNLTARDTIQLFDKETESAENFARENRDAIKDLFQLLNRIEEERLTNVIINNRQSESTIHIMKAGEYLILHFFKNLFRLLINHRINEFSFNASTEVNLMDEFLKNLNIDNILLYMGKNNIENTIYIKLLYLALMCNKHVNDSATYLKFRNLLFGSIDKLTRAESQHLLHLLESIIAQKINAGMLEYYSDLFDTYEYELKHDLYKPNRQQPLTIMKYRNIYLTALKTGKFEWAEKFIHEYRDELQKRDRQSIVDLSMAQLNFEKKDFEATLKYLQKVKTSQIFYKIDVKILSLMALYELSHYETALSAIDSFRKMLANNKTLTEQYSGKNRNFSAILGQLIKSKIDNTPGGRAEILKRISDTPQLGNRNWLIKKAGDLS